MYFVVNEATSLIKIGQSCNVEDRLINLSTSCGKTLKLLHKIFSEDHVDEEKKLHIRFAHLRQSGEWFEYSDEIIQFIENMKSISKFISFFVVALF